MIETGVYRLPDRHSKYLGPENGNPVPGFFWSAELGPENCSRRAVSRGASYGPWDLLDSAGPDFDPARLSVLRFGNAQGQHAVLQVGTDFFRI